MTPRTIIYPGTFDPIHIGHMDLIKRIAAQYDRIIVAVAKDCGSKSPFLTFDERIETTSLAVKSLKLANVETMGMDTPFPLFVRKHKVTAVLRGIRNAKDIEYESMLSNIVHSPISSGFFGPTIEVICLLAPELTNLSSTVIRQKIFNSEDISALVPEAILPYQSRYAQKKDQESHAHISDRIRALNTAVLFYHRNKNTVAAVTSGVALGYTAANVCSIQ